MHAARHLAHVRSLAAARTAARSTGGIALVILVLVVTLIAGLARTARGMADLASQFLRVAAQMTSAFFMMVIVIAVALILLVHP
jgi:hypothetical protein